MAREQNITAAAKALHISQPALSTQLKNMEAELGKKLLIRGVKGSRKVILTEEGMNSAQARRRNAFADAADGRGNNWL